MSITVTLIGEDSFTLLYASVGFSVGLTVTGYVIYPDMEKSDEFAFDELGDGIYGVSIPYTNKRNWITDKYGIVVKENGVPKKFEIVDIIR